MHLSFSSISNFANVRKFAINYPEFLYGSSKVSYRSKVKLHGSNVAIQVVNSHITTQTRESIITPTSDFKGFSNWVNTDEVKSRLIENCKDKIVLFGEYIGSGIQDNVACSQIKTRSFAVFAAVPLTSTNELSDTFITDPSALKDYVLGIPNMYVIPWHGESLTIDLLSKDEDLNPILEKINSDVMLVEKEDPFIKSNFDISGIGEGLVYYPSGLHGGLENFKNFSFKCKGNKHNTIKNSKPVQLDSNKAKSIEEFASLVCSESRLEQGAREANGGDFICSNKLIGPFLAWMLKDVLKETESELKASNLTWNEVKSNIQSFSRNWYLEQIKK